ncbi:cell cycle protein [Leptotrichia trevisanii]|uniref:Probable peptidoglycan glycosyltransferase FtsW n=1 Tax=Leptotrichia trevisanii TaxID=109328 RepID=A0A510K3Z7_9FUSO|nr:FtsW/RodA/SpoVE family cell cycle protein [Leptotrichia trevisanii]BBM46370.1 cell cycle protein [Leptotrichia trevisanii]BBM58323.1 cell cycle protein [Leptotrichia trevisanii]
MNSKKILGTSFIIVIIILSALSLITIASLSFPKGQKEYGKSYYFLMRQAIWLVVGWGLFAFTANVNYKKYKDIAKYLYVIGAFGLILVLLAGKTVNGAKRWIDLRVILLQPSEFAKLFLIITLSTLAYTFKTRNKIKKFPKITSGIMMISSFIYMFLILFEKAFSSTAQITIIALTYLFIAEVKFSIISTYSAIIGIGGWLAITKVGYRVNRLVEYKSKDGGGQTAESLIAIANGKVSGRFYGNGLQKYNFLPEIHTDYVFSGFAEENGFLGVLFLLGLYAALLIIIGIALRKIKDLYAKYLLSGIFIMFATQIIGNVAVASQLIPSTGIPLPMMSYGGSTMIVVMMTLGIVYNILRALYRQEMGSNLDKMREMDYMM